MATIIDSLFLELGIDVSKFSKDQQRALEKIKQFESQTKRAADKASTHVKKVGEAFRDITDDTSVGRSARRLDTMAVKLKSLGQAGRVSGGVTGGLGMMAEGLGSLLSPATLAIAAVTALGAGVWDFDKKMTAANATIYRQAQLSGMNAKSLWAWGEAAKSVGASPEAVTGGIASLQTSIEGMGIGAGNATPQLIALARLGVGYNFKGGVNVKQLFERVHQLAKQSGYKNLGALRALTAPVMDSAEFALATDPDFNPNHLRSQIKHMEPQGFGAVFAEAVESQKRLGLLSASKDTLMERVYGATHSVFDTIAAGIQQLVGYVAKLLTLTEEGAHWIAGIAKHFGVLAHGAAAGAKSGGVAGAIVGALGGYETPHAGPTGRKMVPLVRALMAQGLSQGDAEAIAGNFMQESSLRPFVHNGQHFGLAQWDAQRQALARRKGFNLNTEAGQVGFTAWELHNTAYGRAAVAAMAKAKTPAAKALAFDKFFERAGDLTMKNGKLAPRNLSAVNRIWYAEEVAATMAAASRMLTAASAHHTTVHNRVTSSTRIGDIHVHTPTTDPRGHADAVRSGLSRQPLLNAPAQHLVALATSGPSG